MWVRAIITGVYAIECQPKKKLQSSWSNVVPKKRFWARVLWERREVLVVIFFTFYMTSLLILLCHSEYLKLMRPSRCGIVSTYPASDLDWQSPTHHSFCEQQVLASSYRVKCDSVTTPPQWAPPTGQSFTHLLAGYETYQLSVPSNW